MNVENQNYQIYSNTIMHNRADTYEFRMEQRLMLTIHVAKPTHVDTDSKHVIQLYSTGQLVLFTHLQLDSQID